MKYSKLLAVTFAAVLCIGALPFLVGSTDDVAGDDPVPVQSVMNLNKGDAWGQGVQLTYKDLEPAITDIVKEAFPGVIADDAALLPGLADVLKEFLIDKYTAEDMFYLFDPTTIQNLALRLNFDINEALLAEVVRADGNGYTVDVFGGISMNVDIGATIKAEFIKEGTYAFGEIDTSERALREVFFDANLFAKLMISGSVDFNKEGGIVAADLALDAAFDISLRTNLNLSVDMGINGTVNLFDIIDGKVPIMPESIGIKYSNVTYGLGVEMKLGAKITASRDGIVLIPPTLNEEIMDYMYSTTVKISDVTLSAKLSVTPDLEKLLDGMFGKGFVDSEIMNFVIPFSGNEFGVPGLKLLNNGELNLSDFVWDMVDEIANIITIPIKYELSVVYDDPLGFMIEMIYQDGTYVDGGGNKQPDMITIVIAEDFMWENIKDFEVNFLDRIDPVDNETLLNMIEKLGLSDSFTLKYLEGSEKSDVKKVVDNIKNAKKGGYNNSNIALYAGIGIAAVAAIGVAGFLLFRRT